MVLDRAARLPELMALSGGSEAGHAVLTEDRHVVGVLDLDPPMLRAIRNGGAETPLGDFMGNRFITVRAHKVAFDVISMMESRRAAVAVVLETQISGKPDRVLGVITHHTIAASVAASIRLYPR